jgi:hypothetical protein
MFWPSSAAATRQNLRSGRNGFTSSGTTAKESAERMHKFKVGQSVSLQSTLFNRDAAGGAYKVTKQLFERDGEFEYQVKRPGEAHERVVKERDLSAEALAE